MSNKVKTWVEINAEIARNANLDTAKGIALAGVLAAAVECISYGIVKTTVFIMNKLDQKKE